MTNQCAVCGRSDELLRDCKYCTGVYCPDHALPESHDCPGLAELKEQDEWVRDRETNIPTYRGPEVRPRPEPLETDDVTTYGSTEVEFESSPDVAPDGSIVGEETNDEPRGADEAGRLSKLVSTLKFWT